MAAVLALTACTEETPVTPEGENGQSVAVESVSLHPTELTLTEGDAAALKCTVQPSGASVQTVTWQSGNPSVATVDGQGTVNALAAGTAVITVTTEDGHKTASCRVTVEKKYVGVSGIRVDKDHLILPLGGEELVTASVLPDDATNQAVVWESMDPKVAAVSSTGLVTANSYGSTRIVVSSVENSMWSSECFVDVEMPLDEAEIALSSTSLSLAVGDEAIIRISIKGNGHFTFGWTISPADIVRPSFVQDDEHALKLTALKPGTATIKCMVGDRFGAENTIPCTVTVHE